MSLQAAPLINQLNMKRLPEAITFKSFRFYSRKPLNKFSRKQCWIATNDTDNRVNRRLKLWPEISIPSHAAVNTNFHLIKPKTFLPFDWLSLWAVRKEKVFSHRFRGGEKRKEIKPIWQIFCRLVLVTTKLCVVGGEQTLIKKIVISSFVIKTSQTRIKM